MTTFSLILLAVCINTAAQILLKQGMNHIGFFAFSLANWFHILTKIIFNPFILAGLSCYVGSVFIWLLVLSRVPVSYAYPMTSLGYITTAVIAVLLFNETLTLTRVMGILIIILGVYLISKK
ncbi:MAG: putative 4-amino-4-deoxy-L-arabinose-phosphoundecaprenol flippase subunit ArnF [Legionellaceae bacterium]